MRPKTFNVTSGSKIVPMNWRGKLIAIGAYPSGAGDYTISFTQELPTGGDFSLVTTWTDIPGLTAETANATIELGPVTALRITLNSGTAVQVNVMQNDL